MMTCVQQHIVKVSNYDQQLIQILLKNIGAITD